MQKKHLVVFTILFCSFLSATVAAQNSTVKLIVYSESSFYYSVEQMPSVLAIKRSVDEEFTSEETKIKKRRADHDKRQSDYNKKTGDKAQEIYNSGKTLSPSESEKFMEQVNREMDKFGREDDLIKADEKSLKDRKDVRLKELTVPIRKSVSDFEAQVVKQYQVKLFPKDSDGILLHSDSIDFTDGLFEAYKVFAATNRLPENPKFPTVKVAFVASSILGTEDEDKYDEMVEKLEKFVNSAGYNLIIRYDGKMPEGFSADTDITAKFTANAKSADDYERGIIALNTGGYDYAIEFFSKAIQIDPNNAAAFGNRARAYAAKENYDFAVADLTKAISMNSPSVNLDFLYNYRGKVYNQQKKSDLAIKDFNKSIEIERENPDAFEGRAMTYYQLKQFEPAIKDFTEAIKLKKENHSAYHYRGHSYQSSKNYDLAIADFTKAMEFTENSSHLYYDRARTYSLMENYDLAISDLNQAIQSNPNFANAFLLRSQILCQKGSKKLAAEDEEKVISLGKTVEKRCM